MAVGLRLEFQGMGLDEYDAVAKELNFPAEWPDGALSHASTEGENGLVVYDVWESREKFDAFAAGTLGAAIAKAIGPDAPQPDITEMELHTFYTRDAG